MHGGPTVTKDAKGSQVTTCIAPDAPTTTAATTTTVVPLPQDSPSCHTNDAPFSKESVSDVIDHACHDVVNGKYHNKPGETWSTSWFSGYTFKDPNSKTSKADTHIFVDIGVNQRACPNGGQVNIDFVALGFNGCVNHFQKIVSSCELTPILCVCERIYWLMMVQVDLQ